MKLKTNWATSLLLPRLQDVLFIGILLFTCTQGFRLINGDGDLGRHITIGNHVLENRVVPTHDIFSHTMTGEYLVPHEWLLGVIFALVTRAMGLDGAVLISGIVIASAFVFVYRQSIERGVHRMAAFLITTWAVLASFLHWQVRPHIFTFLFVAVWISILEQAVNNKKVQVWVLPLIMLVWANSHGGFFLGFVILGAYFAGWVREYWRGQANKETGIYLATAGISSFAISFINPAGWHLWITSAGLIGKKFIIDSTSEYLSPNFHTTSTWPFLVMLVAGIFLIGTSRNKLRSHELFMLAGWTALSLYMARNIPLYAIVTAPYLGFLLQPTLSQSKALNRINDAVRNVEVGLHLRGIVYPILATLLVGFAFTSDIRFDLAQKGNQHDAAKFPVAAADWIKENPQDGNMFNEFVWGGYLLYRLWPEQTVYIDGTTDFFGEAFTREYARVVTLQSGWQATIKKYDVSWAILPSDRPLIQALENELGWQIIYQDNTATIIRNP
jgi:hypothetical protein